ncbi:MAG: DUF4150 domain-containing protein [Rhodobacterales bacterium]|nr:DUF4150 domain-containing protein [Rhodobacterales bacterium]
MADVFANGKEVSGKKTTNKSAPAMMSVCLSPPSPPAGPIPIPYPVTDMASNTTDGTCSVVINKKEVGKKNGSTYKKCNGNQPATRNFGMDVVSHTIQGKTRFEAYSFDVMFEKKGAERFMDLTTTNHMNPATAVTASTASAAPPPVGSSAECQTLNGINLASRGQNTPANRKRGVCAAGKYLPGDGSPPQYVRARSTIGHLSRAFPAVQNGYATGLWPKTVRGTGPVPSGMNAIKGCGNREYGNNAQSGMNHAEGKIVEDLLKNNAKSISAGQGGSLLLKIDWPGKHPEPCCGRCKKTLAALCECVNIVLCDENDQSYDWCKDQRCDR